MYCTRSLTCDFKVIKDKLILYRIQVIRLDVFPDHLPDGNKHRSDLAFHMKVFFAEFLNLRFYYVLFKVSKKKCVFGCSQFRLALICNLKHSKLNIQFKPVKCYRNHSLPIEVYGEQICCIR